MAAETVECACTDCVCKVSTEKAVMKDGKPFCSDECASGHPNHKGCGHEGCDCHG